MRKRYEIQQILGTIPISEVSISTKSRHELPAILRALQHIFSNAGLRETILGLLEDSIQKGKRATGRMGMSLWEIFVMGVVRLGMDLDYDSLEDLVNNHKSFRGILGVEMESGFSKAKHYHIQTLKDNVALLDDELLSKINTRVVAAGHNLVKKKGVSLSVKADTYVLETNVHYPTDVTLLYDSGRKCLDMLKNSRLSPTLGSKVDAIESGP